MDDNFNQYTWTDNSNQTHTWEVKSKDQYSWPNTVISTSFPSVTVASTSFQFPTEESMIEDILLRTKESGFFKDMVEWLRKDAPKRLPKILNELVYPIHAGNVSYDRLCEVLYNAGFRTNEMMERRMILGPSNRWVREYFNDFPLGS